MNVILNGKKIRVLNGERLVEIIRRFEPSFPSPCYHGALTETGHCEMCFVGARRKAEDPFTVIFSCTATAKEGMEINTGYEPAVASRNKLIALCSLHHPADCAKCDKVGSCFLQKFAVQSKLPRFSRIVCGKLEGVEYVDIGSGVIFDKQKCIGCQRCVRFCRDILGEEVLGFLLGKGGFNTIELYPGKTLESNYAMNLVDLCQGGALISKNRIYQPSAWNLAKTMSISAESSVGVNTYVLHEKNKVFRIIPRENEHVNGTWMPDSARMEHEFGNGRERLLRITQNGRRLPLKSAISQILKSALSNKLFVVCSGNMSLEDQFVLRRFLDIVVSAVFLLKKTRTGDGFLISDDATPNFNGLILASIASDENIVDDLSALEEAVNSKECKKILAINEDIFAHGLSEDMLKSVDIFYIGTEMNATAMAAKIAIPAATFFEYTGTFINRDWRLQKFYRAVNPPNINILPMWCLFSLMTNSYIGSKSDDLTRIDKVWEEMVNSLPQLANVNFLDFDPSGVVLKFR
ncbi:MAG: (2Fe-2S)-binding protein [Puniceicoccales bacterium]|nr:(2Fe-2S)-binding protein [Puniceicoccales bacterium]